MRRIILESPYSGDVSENVRYACRALRDSLRRGEAPLASHLLYTQVLDDDTPLDRIYGMAAGFAWYSSAECVVVYMDRGVSTGMAAGIALATQLKIPVERRWINASD